MSNNIEVYARIRPPLCWEQRTKSLKLVHDAIGIAPPYNDKIMKPIVNFHQFSHVFQEHESNNDVFEGTVKALCDHSATSKKNKDGILLPNKQDYGSFTKVKFRSGEVR